MGWLKRNSRQRLRVQELAQAQQRTELRVDELGEGGAKAGRATERCFGTALTRSSAASVPAGGCKPKKPSSRGCGRFCVRWASLLSGFWTMTPAGEVFGHPDQVELDVVIQNGKVIVVEIKSSLDQANMYLFDRKVAFYAHKTGRQVDRKLIVTPFVDNRAKEIGLRLGVEICTDITALS